MRQDTTSLGAASTEAILRMLERPEDEPPQLLRDVELIDREPCGPHRREASDGAPRAVGQALAT